MTIDNLYMNSWACFVQLSLEPFNTGERGFEEVCCAGNRVHG
jgi:hypothetical protein